MRFLRVMFFVGFICGFPALLCADNLFWTGNDVNDVWSDPDNWNIGRVPADGDKVVIRNAAQGEPCILDNATGITVGPLAIGDGGAGEMIVRDGGGLTVDTWGAIGYNRSASLTIEGGNITFDTYLAVGMNDDVEGSVFEFTIKDGTVNVSGRFFHGLYFDGSHSSTVRTRLYGGVLNADRVTLDYGTMDITEGTLIINGDRTGSVESWVSSGKITAYGGEGKIQYDYNVTNPGRTTVTAAAPVPGDMDDDRDVDIMDLKLFTGNWLEDDCDNKANFTDSCRVNFKDFSVLSSGWMKGIITDWHIAETRYPTDDYIVTPHYAEDFGIIADGRTDVTDEIQNALNSISNLGGGALFLPAGHYKVAGTLTIPSRVTLHGDWKQPSPDEPVEGTVLMAYSGRGSENGAPFISLSDSSGVKGVSIWYPEQNPSNIQPYPPTIQRSSGSNHSIENVTFVNSYFGFTTYQDSITAAPFVRNVYGTPLKTGIEFDCLADIGRIETVHFSPDYWKNSGLPRSPVNNEHTGWIYNNGTGIILRRIDWSYSAYVTVEGYNTGLALIPSRYDGNDSNGQCYGYNLINCKTGIDVTKSSYAGFLFTRFNIQGAETGVYFSPDTDQPAMLNTCTIDASDYAVLNEGWEKVIMQNCDIQSGRVQVNNGYFSILSSHFAPAEDSSHIQLGENIRGASILGNDFDGGAQITDNSSYYYPVYIDHNDISASSLPEYDYKKPEREYKAAKKRLYVVTNPPFNAEPGDGADDSAAFQAALSAAQADGGGIVFVPGGSYHMDDNLTVPGGVELRGVFNLPHNTGARGSVLNISTGKGQLNGTPFIRLEADSGIRGLTFHYPEQIYDDTNTDYYGMEPYPFMIQGMGSDVYVINIAATVPYQLLDLATYRCDNHYVDYIWSTALKTGIHIGGGTVDGQVHNCQFNPSAYAFGSSSYESIPSDAGGVYELVWDQAKPYLFGDITGQVLHHNFVFGGMYGFHLTEENGSAPSGHCMGMGVDQCTVAMQIDDIGGEGFDLINTQLVTVDGTNGRYLRTGASLDDDFRMFGTSCWGTNDRSVVIKGGNLELQQFHIARDAETAAFDIRNDANVRVLGGNVTDYVDTYLMIESTAAGEFLGNIINTASSQMPSNTSNVTSRGNLRVR